MSIFLQDNLLPKKGILTFITPGIWGSQGIISYDLCFHPEIQKTSAKLQIFSTSYCNSSTYQPFMLTYKDQDHCTPHNTSEICCDYFVCKNLCIDFDINFLRRVDLENDYCAGKSLGKFWSYKSLIQFSECTTILEISGLLCQSQETLSGCF